MHTVADSPALPPNSIKSRTAFLIANAHIDPVWLWQWEEGLGAALSTFRSAANLCEEFESFVFNHNEALLYEWVEEYEPALFRRIQRLVERGRWHIMGGWYLQPDCNLPSGESMARQIERGRHYFAEKFKARPTTAINFDPFGHSHGLVQILNRYGFDSYLICRPDNKFCPLPGNDIIWKGFDGSEVMVRRVPELYNSPMGKAREHAEKRLGDSVSDFSECVLWGVGNHGGGPSRKDLEDLAQSEGGLNGWSWQHATPEDYFQALSEHREELPVIAHDLNRWAVGCYTSQVRIKQEHRLLENELFRAEKMATHAAALDLMEYPEEQLRIAERDLLISEFHDILPGSSIQAVEEASLRLLNHGREIASRATTRAFYALLAGQPDADEGTYPVLIYNPHPHELEAEIDIEFQMADQNWNDPMGVEVKEVSTGNILPSQLEKEACNMPLDWRKRVLFRAKLPAAAMSRFDLRLVETNQVPLSSTEVTSEIITIPNENLTVTICRQTGRLLSIVQDGQEQIGPEGAGLEVVADVADSWVGQDTRLGDVIGQFTALDPRQAAAYAGLDAQQADSLEAVRVLEEGSVRTVVEALCGWGDSLAQILYTIPHQGTRLGVEVRLHWSGKDQAVKWSQSLPQTVSIFTGQTMFGHHELPFDGTECVFHQWCGIENTGGYGNYLVNADLYGGDCDGKHLRLTLVRGAAYSAHAWEDREYLPKDRFIPRMDQGERHFRFWLENGPVDELAPNLDNLALTLNQPPFALQVFPSGEGQSLPPGSRLSNEVLMLSSLRQGNGKQNAVELRLFNPTAQRQATSFSWLGQDLGQVSLEPHSFAGWQIEDSAIYPVDYAAV